MSLVAAVSSHLVTTFTRVARVAVNRLGVTPVLVLAFATAAVLLSLRPRPRPRPQGGANAGATTDARGRRRRRTQQQQQQSSATRNVPAAGEGVTVPAPETASATLVAIPSMTQSTITSAITTAEEPHDALLPVIPHTLRKPQWLSRVRRVSIGTTCSASTPSQLFTVAITNAKPATPTSPTIFLTPDAIGPLSAFASLFEVFIVVRVDDDEAETAVTNAFAAAGLFNTGFLDRRKLVFTETEAGRVSVARQLEPHLHVDDSLDVTVGLQRFLPSVALVSPDARTVPSDVLGRNVAKLSSFASFFS